MVNDIIPVWPIQRLDRFGIEILDRLLVAPTHAIPCPSITVESIYRLSNAHLRSSHRYRSQHPANPNETTSNAPRNESKYPFASFCKRVDAASMVRNRLSIHQYPKPLSIPKREKAARQ